MASGATFIAQSVSSDIKQLTAIIQQAMDHKGFSFINVFSPCVTYNKVNTYDWFKENLIPVEDIVDYDHTDAQSAMQNMWVRMDFEDSNVKMDEDAYRP